MLKKWLIVGTLGLGCLLLTAPLVRAQIKVLVVPKGTQTVFWKNVAAGAQKAGGELGIQVTYRGPLSQDQHQAQVHIVEFGIRKHYDAIVLAPNHVELPAPALKAAVARGIKVVLIDSNMNSHHHTSFIESNNYEAGEKAADYAAGLINGAGNLALVRFMQHHASTHEREQGFIDRLEARYPHVSLTAQVRGGSTVGSAYHCVSKLLAQSPSMEVIFSVNEPTTMGALRALRERHLQEKIKLIGFDSNTEINKAILSGEMAATIAQDPFNIGYMGVITAHRLVQGEAVPPRIHTDTVLIDAGNYHTAKVAEIIRSNTPPVE